MPERLSPSAFAPARKCRSRCRAERSIFPPLATFTLRPGSPPLQTEGYSLTTTARKCAASAYIQVVLQNKRLRDAWRHQGSQRRQVRAGNPELRRMRVNEPTGRSESPDTIPI